mgnify:CR=1 FL=1
MSNDVIRINSVILAKDRYSPPSGYSSRGLVKRNGETYMLFAPSGVSRDRAMQLLNMRTAKASITGGFGSSFVSETKVIAEEGDVVTNTSTGETRTASKGEKITVYKKTESVPSAIPPDREVVITDSDTGETRKVDTTQYLSSSGFGTQYRRFGYEDFGSVVETKQSVLKNPDDEQSFQELAGDVGASGDPVTNLGIIGAGFIGGQVTRSFNSSTGEVIFNEDVAKATSGVVAGVFDWMDTPSLTNPLPYLKSENIGRGINSFTNPVPSAYRRFRMFTDDSFSTGFQTGRTIAPTIASMVLSEAYLAGIDTVTSQNQQLDRINADRWQAEMEYRINQESVNDIPTSSNVQTVTSGGGAGSRRPVARSPSGRECRPR